MNIEAGDVFLMCGDAKTSKYLATAQKLIYKNAKSSHILFSLGNGSFVHSTPDCGVDFAFYEDILKECKDGWRVIRFKNLTTEQREAMMKKSIYLIDQTYNRKFFFKSNDTSSFCSELVAKIFESASINLFGKETGTVTPADFDRAADGNTHWEDVTASYRERFEEMAKNPHPYRSEHNMCIQVTRHRQSFMQLVDKIYDTLKLAVDNNELPKELLDKAIANEHEFRKNKNISFWNEKRYPNPNQPKSDEN